LPDEEEEEEEEDDGRIGVELAEDVGAGDGDKVIVATRILLATALAALLQFPALSAAARAELLVSVGVSPSACLVSACPTVAVVSWSSPPPFVPAVDAVAGPPGGSGGGAACCGALGKESKGSVRGKV
jgi:hypothetical protein